MNYSSRLGQIRIYFGKCLRGFKNEQGWKSLIGAIIIPILLVTVMGEDVFAEYTDTSQGSFAIICACLWIGLFNSLTSVCKERNIIKHEYRAGLYLSSYITAHMIFELIISLIETAFVAVIILIRYWDNLGELGDDASVKKAMIVLTFFLSIYAADALGILISSIVKNTVAAMYLMPFILIFQLVFAGCIFPLENISEVIGNLTLSKWGYKALLDISEVEQNSIMGSSEEGISYIICWTCIIAFTIIYALVSCKVLKNVEKDHR